MRDELRHMAPRHRLAIELSDQSKDTNAQFKQTVMNRMLKSKSQNYRVAV